MNSVLRCGRLGLLRNAGYFEDVGMERSVPMAAKAGCDVMMICHTYERQKEGIESLLEAVKSGLISLEQVSKSAERVAKMKDRYLSWENSTTHS